MFEEALLFLVFVLQLLSFKIHDLGIHISILWSKQLNFWINFLFFLLHLLVQLNLLCVLQSVQVFHFKPFYLFELPLQVGLFFLVVRILLRLLLSFKVIKSFLHCILQFLLSLLRLLLQLRWVLVHFSFMTNFFLQVVHFFLGLFPNLSQFLLFFLVKYFELFSLLAFKSNLLVSQFLHYSIQLLVYQVINSRGRHIQWRCHHLLQSHWVPSCWFSCELVCKLLRVSTSDRLLHGCFLGFLLLFQYFLHFLFLLFPLL